MIFSTIASILGSSGILEKGMELIDDAYTSDEEQRESKTKAKVELMKAYAPFKVAQRYLALMFSFTFLTSFFVVLVMTLMGKGDPDLVVKVLDQFGIQWIMLTIVGFYFGGGLAESVMKPKVKS